MSRLSYKVIYHDEMPELEGFERLDDVYSNRPYCLVEFVDDKPARIVGEDGGEPEDQLLVRDWKWVPVMMNELAEKLAAAEAMAEHLERQRSDAMSAFNQMATERDAARRLVEELMVAEARLRTALAACRTALDKIPIIGRSADGSAPASTCLGCGRVDSEDCKQDCWVLRLEIAGDLADAALAAKGGA